MIDLTKAILPSSIFVDGKIFKIKTDHYYWIMFSNILCKKEVRLDSFDYLYEGEILGDKLISGRIPDNQQVGFSALKDFFIAQEELPRKNDDANNISVINYNVDGSLIYAAFKQQYNIDIIDTPIHWHKFCALLRGVKGTLLNDVIEYRLYDRALSNYDDTMASLKEAWALQEDNYYNDSLEKFNNRFD